MSSIAAFLIPDHTPQALPVREQQVDQVPQGGRLSLRGLRPDALPRIGSAGDDPATRGAEPKTKIIELHRYRRQNIRERRRNRGGNRNNRRRGCEKTEQREEKKGVCRGEGQETAGVHQPDHDPGGGRQPDGLPPAPPAAGARRVRPEVQTVCGRGEIYYKQITI